MFGLHMGMSPFGGQGEALSLEQIAKLFKVSRSHAHSCIRSGQVLFDGMDRNARDAG